MKISLNIYYTEKYNRKPKEIRELIHIFGNIFRRNVFNFQTKGSEDKGDELTLLLLPRNCGRDLFIPV